jgi:hypothetical protein
MRKESGAIAGGGGAGVVALDGKSKGQQSGQQDKYSKWNEIDGIRSKIFKLLRNNRKINKRDNNVC